MNLGANSAIIYAQYRILNSILLDKDNISKYNLTEDIFIHNICKSIFKVISESKNEKFSKSHLFQDVLAIDLNVTQDSIDNIFDLDENQTDLISAIKILETGKKSLKLKDLLEDTINILDNTPLMSEEDSTKIKNNLDIATQNIFSTEEPLKMMDTEEWGINYLEEFEKRKNGKIYYFGDDILDDLITEGPAPQTGGIIFASSGMGKTSYVINLINGFINREIPTIFYTLEMSTTSIYDRIASLRTEIPYKDISNPKDIYTFETIKSSIVDVHEIIKKNKKFRICGNANISLNDLKNDIINFKKSCDTNYCIVAIDLLSMIKEFSTLSSNGNTATVIEFAINRLNAMSKELNFHWIGVVQSNRNGEKEKITDFDDIEECRPNINSIKNANAFRERARYVVSLFRPKYYADTYLSEDPYTEEMDDIMEIGLLKQNNGKTGKRKALFDPEIFKIITIKNTID